MNIVQFGFKYCVFDVVARKVYDNKHTVSVIKTIQLMLCLEIMLCGEIITVLRSIQNV
jgi:hypothetical protein